MDYINRYLQEMQKIAGMVDQDQIKKAVQILADVRKNEGRLFFLGVGGGAGNCTHAVNDFRKIAGIESYAPTDNASELTARTNDNGWETVFSDWLRVSRVSSKDAVFVFSVGGGNEEKNISLNIVRALQYSKEMGAKVLGIVGRDGGYTAKIADACMLIPVISQDTVTPHTEAFQANIWHLIVSHPDLKASEMKWESVK